MSALPRNSRINPSTGNRTMRESFCIGSLKSRDCFRFLVQILFDISCSVECTILFTVPICREITELNRFVPPVAAILKHAAREIWGQYKTALRVGVRRVSVPHISRDACFKMAARGTERFNSALSRENRGM